MEITKPKHTYDAKKTALKTEYEKQLANNTELTEEELEEDEVLTYGLQELKNRRLIPIGKGIYTGKPTFLKYPELTPATFNVYTFVGPMGCGKSVAVRNMIYYSYKFDPQSITIVFDPMIMEYRKLSIKATDDEDIERKKEHLLDGIIEDKETHKPIQISIDPDNVPVFHLIPRFAIKTKSWNPKTSTYEQGYNTTVINILKKDGGVIFAEDCSKLELEELFSALNYRELKGNHGIKTYLRKAMELCDQRYGPQEWYIGDLIDILKEGVRKYRDVKEIDDIEDAEIDKKLGLNTTEMQLIDHLERYNDAGFFIRNEDERKKHTLNFHETLKISRIINISYLSYKRTESVGKDFAAGQTHLMLKRLINISKEYDRALMQKEQKEPISEWQQYLLDRWKVNLWFEESEIFVPRDCPVTDYKKWPCIGLIEEIVSIGRKLGFKNMGFVTQRVQKVNKLVFETTTDVFLGPIAGEERDKIINNFGVNKLKYPLVSPRGQRVAVPVRDLVSTLQKSKFQWIYISKDTRTVAPISTYDSPCGA